MTAIISFIHSALAIAISGTTAWLTLFRRGQVKMTTPTVIFLGPDGGPKDGTAPLSKIYLRTLLYSTAKRGHIVESMYVSLRRGESTQHFNIWVYGEDSLARGSGLFIGEDGVVCDHHFLLPADGTTFEFKPGDYILEIFASLVGSETTTSLFQVPLTITSEQATKLLNNDNGLYFDWGSDNRRYQAHVRLRPKRALPSWLSELAG